jgi:LysM repeat protein
MRYLLTHLGAAISAALAAFTTAPVAHVPHAAPLAAQATPLTAHVARVALAPLTSKASCTYIVQSGDTLTTIAARLGIAWTTLYQMNAGVIGGDPNHIMPGMQLATCGGVGHTPVAPNPPDPPVNNAPAGTGSVQSMIAQTFGGFANEALAVARCESGFNPNAYNSTAVYYNGRYLGHAKGVFQIIDATWASTSYANDSPYNAWDNIQAAHEIFARDGYSWREWQCQP